MNGELFSIPIRYDGLDAERHQIELHLLGESIQGVARLLAVSGHFAATGQYAKQMPALDVKVFVNEPRANCFTLDAVIAFARDQQLFAGAVGVVLGPLLGWFVARISNNRAEMKALKDSLDKAIGHLANHNADLIPKYLATVEKMAESLTPAMRAAVAPVGKTCSTMRIGSDVAIDEATANAIRSLAADEVTETRVWDVRITELDLESKSGKIRLEDSELEDEKRFKAVITDPAIAVINSDYVRAFAEQRPIRVRGKAVLRDGEIQTLYVSDTA